MYFLEVFEDAKAKSTMEAERVCQWNEFIPVCKNQFRSLAVPWHDFLLDVPTWCDSPAQIVFTQYYKTEIFDISEASHRFF